MSEASRGDEHSDGQSTMELPTSIEVLLTSRIDQLPADQQLWLKVSALVGATFSMAQAPPH